MGEFDFSKVAGVLAMLGIDANEVKTALAEWRRSIIKETLESIPKPAKQESTEINYDLLAEKVVKLMPQAAPINPADLDTIIEKLSPKIYAEVARTTAESEIKLANKIAAAIEEINKKIDNLSTKVSGSGSNFDVESFLKRVESTAASIANQYSETNFKAFQAAVYQELAPLMELSKQIQNQGGGNPQPISESGEIQTEANINGQMPVQPLKITNLIASFLQPFYPIFNGILEFGKTPAGQELTKAITPSISARLAPKAALADPMKHYELAMKIVKIRDGLKLTNEQFDQLTSAFTGKESQTAQIKPPA